MEQMNDQRFDVEARHAAEAIAIYKAVTGKGEAAYSREKSRTKWELAAIAVSDIRRGHPASAHSTLSKIGEVVACAGRDWPDVPGEVEILRRVKWLARQCAAASANGREAARALPAGMELVAGQCRFVGDLEWRPCAVEHVRLVLATPQDWDGYEVRYLYAEAPRSLAAQERYRLLVRGIDTIQAGDAFLQDDAVTWQPDPNGIFVGMTYVGNVLPPARRAIEPAP